MDQNIIDAVASAGFDVWMQDEKSTWMLFTDDIEDFRAANSFNTKLKLVAKAK